MEEIIFFITNKFMLDPSVLFHRLWSKSNYPDNDRGIDNVGKQSVLHEE